MSGEKRKAELESQDGPGAKRSRAREHSDERSYNIFVGSWNVNQKNPKQVDWKKWLSPPVTANQPSDVNSHSDAEQVHAGLEVTEMKHDEDPPPPEVHRFDNWNTEFMNYINTCRTKDVCHYLFRAYSEQLVPVFDASLGGTGLFIFSTPEVRAEIAEEDTNLVEVGRSKTTIKGAVCYRCTLTSFPPLSLSFAGVHFTADQERENVEDRIRDYHLVNNSVFPKQNKKFLADHGYAISFSCLVGDVNFRINLPRDEIAQRVNEGDYDALFDYDQREGKAFVEYSEGKINFPPTYKYIIGTDKFDLTEPPGKRSPAYTDRIFFQHHNPEASDDEKEAEIHQPDTDVQVEVHHYTLGRLVESDHKPVSCYVTVRVGTNKYWREGAKKEDKVEIADKQPQQKKPDPQPPQKSEKKDPQPSGGHTFFEGDTSKILMLAAFVALFIWF